MIMNVQVAYEVGNFMLNREVLVSSGHWSVDSGKMPDDE
jgi:hypothetical protein